MAADSQTGKSGAKAAAGAKWYHARLWAGMNLGGWLRLLVKNRVAVSPSRWPMAAGITVMATANSALSLVESLGWGRAVAQVDVPDDPIFIVGHWRTGTTMLHEMFGLDSRMRCPTTYECLSPCHFLLTEEFVQKRLWFVIPRHRPMDNVRVGFERPQEDEAALCNLGHRSPFLTVAFPNRPLQYPRYRDFSDLTAGELDRWEKGIKQFLRRVLYKQRGQLVLKSPQHTYRIRHLLKAFPRARFVHLSRDPYLVFRSTVHFWRRMYSEYGLQKPNFNGLEEFVLEHFEHMQLRLNEDRGAVDPQRWIQLRYEDLIADPVSHMEAIYEQLNLGDFEPARRAIEKYAAKRYRTNQFEELEASQVEQINQRWADYFDRYGYEMRAT